MKCAIRVIHHFGGRAQACDALGINPETMRLWMRDGIPVARALFIEKKTGFAVTGEEILQEARRQAQAA